MANWRIYYSDGTTYDQGQGGAVPARDVQVIVQKSQEVGWHTRAGDDYYVQKGDEWVGVDIFGLFDYLLDTGLVLFGRTVTNKEFQEVIKRALADREFGLKTGYLPKERRK